MRLQSTFPKQAARILDFLPLPQKNQKFKAAQMVVANDQAAALP
jgi:hypothetical protein